jgi:hypothetical protein
VLGLQACATTQLGVFYSTGLLAMNSVSYCLSENIFILVYSLFEEYFYWG